MNGRLAVALASALLLATTLPVSAAGHTTTGIQLSILGGGTTFPANAPFFVRHGQVIPSDADAIAKYRVSLAVDGELRAPDFKWNATTENGDLIRGDVWNFPSGLTDSHVFVLDFQGPCGDQSGVPCGSNPPNTEVDFGSVTKTVTFVP
jgi:hypothetical protein